MSDTVNAESLEVLLARLAALRNQASPPLDPVRLHFAQALASRLPASPPAVQRVLRAKLEGVLQDLNGGVDEAGHGLRSESTDAPVPASTAGRPKTQISAQPESAAPMSLLGELNQHIHSASQSPANGAPLSAAPSMQDLKSAVRFRETWARISAETQVDKAAHRAPENAGPLNAHNLVLRALALMRDLSPDYLRRFMGHTESLLWLDMAYGQLKQPGGKGKPLKAPKRTKPIS